MLLFLILPSLQFYSIVFLLVPVLFLLHIQYVVQFINAILHGLLITSVQCNEVDDGRYRSFLATPLVNLLSYAYMMKQADKEVMRLICLGRKPSSKYRLYTKVQVSMLFHNRGPKARGCVNRVETKLKCITDLYHGLCGPDDASSW